MKDVGEEASAGRGLGTRAAVPGCLWRSVHGMSPERSRPPLFNADTTQIRCADNLNANVFCPPRPGECCSADPPRYASCMRGPRPTRFLSLAPRRRAPARGCRPYNARARRRRTPLQLASAVCYSEQIESPGASPCPCLCPVRPSSPSLPSLSPPSAPVAAAPSPLVPIKCRPVALGIIQSLTGLRRPLHHTQGPGRPQRASARPACARVLCQRGRSAPTPAL